MTWYALPRRAMMHVVHCRRPSRRVSLLHPRCLLLMLKSMGARTVEGDTGLTRVSGCTDSSGCTVPCPWTTDTQKIYNRYAADRHNHCRCSY